MGWSRGSAFKPSLKRHKSTQVLGGEGRNRAPLVADDMVIMPYFIGYSNGHNTGWIVRTILGAQVGAMTSARVRLPARMFPKEIVASEVIVIPAGFLSQSFKNKN